MKTSRSNSFRLHRITKGSSLKKWNEGDSLNTTELPFKLDVIHSVTKGVKYNDLSYITGRELNKLRKQPASQTDLGIESAQMNMNDMRKKYDDIKKKSKNLQKAIFHLKEEKQRYLLKLNGFDGDKNKGKDKVQNLQTQLTEKKLQLNAVQTQKNVLKSIVSRHHSDKVFYDQKKFDLQQQYSHLKKQLKIFLKEGTGVGENNDRASKVYQKFLKQLQAEKKQRQDHLKNTSKLLFAKAAVLESNQIRGIQIQQIAERAMLDKNLNEKQWEKIFMTHKLLSHMLKSKIQRQMQKFSTVQFAFKEIKTATGVTEANILVQKYLNKEEVYGDLLSKISQNQKRIQILKNETDSLLLEQKTLESQKQVYQNTKITQLNLHGNYESYEDDLKELEVFQNKSLSAQLLKTKLINWLQRQSKKFQLFNKKSVTSNQKKSFIQLFKDFSEKLIESLQISQKNQGKSQLNLQDEPQSEKVLRISPKKSKINEKGQEIYELDQQEGNTANFGKNICYQAEQNDVLMNQREQVLKSNEKFMKELRKKREEMKKVLIEVMQKQKKQKPKVQTKKDD